jgi:hypothetical protein
MGKTRVGLVHQRGGLQSVIATARRQTAGSDAPKLAIDEGNEGVARGKVSAAPEREKFRDRRPGVWRHAALRTRCSKVPPFSGKVNERASNLQITGFSLQEQNLQRAGWRANEPPMNGYLFRKQVAQGDQKIDRKRTANQDGCDCEKYSAFHCMSRNGGEILPRVEQTLSRRAPAIAATFGRP